MYRQHWMSEGESYMGGFVLLKLIDPVMFHTLCVTDSMYVSNTNCYV